MSDWVVSQKLEEEREVNRLRAENQRLREESVDNYNRLQRCLELLGIPEDSSAGAIRDAVKLLKTKSNGGMS